MHATNPPSKTALESSSRSAVVDASSSLIDNPSSYALKLFRHQDVVTYADPQDPTLRTPSEPSIYTAAIQVLSILEVSIIIAACLLPSPPPPRAAVDTDKRRATYLDITCLGRVCTSLYMSAMHVLYQRVFWLPSLWYVLVDNSATLSNPYIDMVVSNPPLLLIMLRLQFDDRRFSKYPESVVAYKLRRFLFITAQVRALNISNADLSPEIWEYVTALLPTHRTTLLPGLRTASWLDYECLIPNFLFSPLDKSRSRASSLSPDNSKESDGSLSGGRSLRSWLPFDTANVRTLNLQMRTFVSPTDRTTNQGLFLALIQQLRNQCRAVFPRLDRLIFLICHQDYHKPSILSRHVVNAIGSFVLETSAVPLSTSIAQPPTTLPFKKEHIQGSGLVEGIAINGYLSHAPILNAAGETANGTAPPDAYPMLSAHLVSSETVLAIACTTNMTHSSVEERHAICRILSPAVDFLGLDTIILHLETISLRLSHSDLIFIGEKWKNIRTLDLRFKVIVTNEHLDLIQAFSVQNMTKPDRANRLKRLHIPELDLRNFRNLMKYRQDTLTTLTSGVLHFNQNEVEEVCAALLSAYPNLMTVTGPGSAPGWDRFAKILESLREKRRAERASRYAWAQFAQTSLD